MSEETQRIYIETRVQDRLKAARPMLPIMFPNTAMKEPTGGHYAKFAILNGKTLTIGGRGDKKVTDRTVGIVQATIYAPEEKGMSEATKIADIFKLALCHHRARLSDGDVLTFKTSEVIRPETDRKGWAIILVRISFYRDETVAVD